MYTYSSPKNKKSCADIASPAVRFGRDFCLETGIHGFRHIAEPKRHWFERLVWLLATSLACYGALDVSLGQLQRYNESPTVVTLEKDFRSWRFSLPAITVCMKNRVDPNKLAEVIKNYWDTDPGGVRYEYYSRFVHTAANSDILHLDEFQEFADDDLDVDLFQLVVDVMPSSDEISKTWSSESAYFKWTPVMTESGVCFSTNSRAVDDVAISKADINDTKAYPITCKYSALSCYIMPEVYAESYYYVHSPYDVMDITSPPARVIKGLKAESEMTVMETGSGKGVRELKPTRRGCLYTDEPTSKGKQVYSTNTCRLSCRSEVAMKNCQCKPFYYFYEGGPQCSPAGMACLARQQTALASIAGVRCECRPQCTYSLFRENSRDDTLWETGVFSGKGSIKYSVQAPRTRYTREIVFHFQDLVVSFGGAAGLFLGASFISFVEILHYILARIFKAIAAKGQSMPFELKKIMELTTILGESEHKLNSTKQPVIVNISN